MSHPLVSRSPDLLRLRVEGYDIEVRANYLVLHHVPYVTAAVEVAYGTLVSELSTTGTTTIRPNDHVVSFVGGIPHDHHGAELVKVVNSKGANQLAEGLVAACTFSAKPPQGYADYFEKMTTYVNLLAGHAQVIDPTATARTFPPVRTTEDESVFRYLDAASGRARISGITEKLALPKVAIIGLGGTGSYILDAIAKTPIGELHLFDGDILYAHNAFRAPGAASADELDERPFKVEYYQRHYDSIRRNIIAHPYYVDESNIDELAGMSFVFLTMDSSPAKKVLVEKLEQFGIAFIDAGMGVYRTDDTLGGILTVTASTPERRAHAGKRISFTVADDDDYERNIQIADLNMLNAVLAVIKWKKLYRFYADSQSEMYMTYTIRTNQLLSDDHPTS